VARITRKALKTDKFALEVGHTVDFFEEHRQDLIRYGVIAAVVLAIAAGIYFYRSHQHAAREQALTQALQVLESPVGAPSPSGGTTYPTEQARDEAAAKSLAGVAAKYSGSSEGSVAEYTLACMAADQGRMAEAEKRFKDVVDSGDKQYASLARLSLAQIYFSTDRVSQGEELLRKLVDSPTIFVSKDEATIALARGLARTKPAEARKLLDPLRASRNSAVSQAAIQAYSEVAQ
jgi:predicted negative regulator of RcsB-dependent stress response